MRAWGCPYHNGAEKLLSSPYPAGKGKSLSKAVYGLRLLLYFLSSFRFTFRESSTLETVRRRPGLIDTTLAAAQDTHIAVLLFAIAATRVYKVDLGKYGDWSESEATFLGDKKKLELGAIYRGDGGPDGGLWVITFRGFSILRKNYAPWRNQARLIG